MSVLLKETVYTNEPKFGFVYDKVEVTFEKTEYTDLNFVTFMFYNRGEKVSLYQVKLEARYKNAEEALNEITKLKYTNEGYFKAF